MIIETSFASSGVFLFLKLTLGLIPLLLLGNKKMLITLVMTSEVLKLTGPNGQFRMLEIMDRLVPVSSVKSPGEELALKLSLSVVEPSPSPHQGQIVFWKSLDGNHYLKNLLTKTWGCSVKEANQWFARTDTTKPTPRSKVWKRKLVEDGDIESQPGPDSLDIITLNAGGSLATWQALKVLLNETHFDVVQLQDVRLTTKYWSALFRTASSKGYVGYHGPGTYTKDRWQNSIPRGGVATFVAKKCKSKLISHAHKEHSQLLCVAVQGLLLFNGYAPPGHEDLPQDELAEMFVDLFQGHGLTEVQPWVISGDFNEKPHDGNLSNLFEAYAGHYFGIGNPTRWDGSREVDWYSTNRPQSVLQVDSCDLHFSDHIPLRLRLQLHFEETLQGTLQKFVDYSIPVDLSHNHWQVILENAWASVDSVRNLFDLLQNDDIDVQKEWDEFPAC